MALRHDYPEDFLRIWHAWPSWPTGRSKKQEAYRKFVIAKRELKFTDADINELVGLIDQMKLDRESWQKGDSYGPQGLQVWIHQRGWQDDYKRKKKSHHQPGAGFAPPPPDPRPVWEQKGMTEEAYERMVDEAHQDSVRKLKKLGMLRNV